MFYINVTSKPLNQICLQLPLLNGASLHFWKRLISDIKTQIQASQIIVTTNSVHVISRKLHT